MIHLKVPIFFLLAFVVCTFALGGGKQQQGFGGMYSNPMTGGFPGQNFGGPMARMGRQQYGGDDGKKYRANLYNDEDVYGYDAKYPGGDVGYINYKSKDARARRGPEFARTSRAYSARGGAGSPGAEGGSSSYGQMPNRMGVQW